MKKCALISCFLLGVFLLGGFWSVNLAQMAVVSSDGEIANITPEAPKAAAITLTNTTNAPAVQVILTKNGVNVTFTLQRIVEYIQNGSIPLVGKNDSGSTWKGINPLWLMQVCNWDAASIIIRAVDAFEKSFEVSHFILRDKAFYKYSVNNATMLTFMVNGTLLIDYNAGADGAFKIMGDSLSGSQKVKKVIQIRYDLPWAVKVTVNGTLKGYIAKTNMTTIPGINLTTYSWGYYDVYGNTGWPSGASYAYYNLKGITVASIIAAFCGNINYTVKTQTADGYASTNFYTKAQVEQGYSGYLIENNTQVLSNQGKQMMLATEKNGTTLGYAEGPFWLIIPGSNKGTYAKEVIQIEITEIPLTPVPTTPPADETPAAEDKKVDGFNVQFMLVFMAVGLVAGIIKRRRQ